MITKIMSGVVSQVIMRWVTMTGNQESYRSILPMNYLKAWNAGWGTIELLIHHETGTVEDDTQQQAAQSESEHNIHFASNTHIGVEEDIPAEFEVEFDSPSLDSMENSTAKGVGEGKRGRAPPEASHYTGVKKIGETSLMSSSRRLRVLSLTFLAKILEGKVCMTPPSWIGQA